jgi:hypothetical protein
VYKVTGKVAIDDAVDKATACGRFIAEIKRFTETFEKALIING